ncbi:MAG TPA: hypothetical protein VGH90_10910 [Chthoniobacteraceae bacterium]
MTQKTKSFLRNQLIEMDRLAESAANDPLMDFAVRKRRESLEAEMAHAPAEPPKPRAVLFFAGPPVYGSRGIDAQFATEALSPFLEMVKTQYSAQKHGGVGARGPRKGEAEARLQLTGLPRGSFGLELSQPAAEDFVAAEQLSQALVRLTNVIASAGDSDERFALSLDYVSPRVLPRLQEFFGVIASAHACLGMESGELKVDLPAERVQVALERVGAAKTEEMIEETEGIFRGATLDSWRFDFRSIEGGIISGRIGDEVDEGAVESMIPLTMKECVATLRIIAITTSDGTNRRRFELLSLRPLERFKRIES